MQPDTSASLEIESRDSALLTLIIKGHLDTSTTGDIWRRTMPTLESAAPRKVIVDASGIEYCDGAGIGFLLELDRRQRKSGGTFEVRGLRHRFQEFLELFNPDEFLEPAAASAEFPNIPEDVGRISLKFWREVEAFIGFIGELSILLLRVIRSPGILRWKDAYITAETAGVDALPIIALIAFLMGLILAFQSAMPMRQFGADIFVANLVALSMLRELGPLMTAIVLAGRSGSAFAAELGTMKVNEEVDALTTMGLNPVRFLVLPRVIAGVIMTPLLTVFADFVGVLSGSLVLMSLGYSFSAYYNQVLAAVDHTDFMGGLVKSVAFGIAIACVGCFRGLRTGTGASAVGETTTLSVVSSIILIVIIDGVFSIIYFYLGV